MIFRNAVMGTLIVSLLSGCNLWRPAPTEKPEVYTVATRRFAPPPPYNRIKKVYLPSVIPAYDAEAGAKAVKITPTYTVSVQNASVCEVGENIAKAAGYSIICTPSAQSRRISLQAEGSIEQISSSLEDKSQMKVSVDHYARQVRIVNRSQEG